MEIQKRLRLFVAILMILGGYFFFTDSKSFDGAAESFAGEIKVSLLVKGDKIEDIKVISNSDTKELSEPAIKILTKKIIEKQSADVDGVAGATYSSDAFKAAVAMAITKSGIDLTKVKKIEKNSQEKNKINEAKADIVVIGGGGAGLAAAIEATEKGAKVILIEKMPILGGNTIYATGGLNATGTDYQKNDDSEEIFFNDTMKGGNNINNPTLVKILAKKSGEAVKWLVDRGADLTDVGRMAGASKDRTHRPTGGDKVGPNIVAALIKKAEELKVDIRVMTTATDILSENGEISGVVADHNGDKYTIKAKAVILATGGFGNNEKLFATLDPKLKGFVSTNHPGATGDAIELVKPYDVALIDMEQIQTHPTVVPSNKAMITEAVRGNGAILLNREGKRFINELETRDVVSKAILEQTGGTAYLFFDTNVRESLKAIESYVKMGILVEGKDLREMSEKLKMDYSSLEETIKRYNGGVESGKDILGRNSLPTELDKKPYFAVEVAPGVHHTMGGLKIDENAQVYNKKGTVVKGLYAAGEVVGGVHGSNRLGGNALTDIIVFGRIAGDSAVEYIGK